MSRQGKIFDRQFWPLWLLMVTMIAVVAGAWLWLQRDLSQINSDVVETIVTVEPELTPAQLVAQDIVRQISRHADERGFYGSHQYCDSIDATHYDCLGLFTHDYLGNGQSEASFRQTLAVIWARYQLYRVTGDQEQLTQLQQDVDNLYNIAASDTYSLQSNRYKCLLLKDIIADTNVEENTRQQAKTLCLFTFMEYYPDSILIHDQHYHIRYQANDEFTGDRSSEMVIGTDVPATKLRFTQAVNTYQPADIQVQINDLLTDIADDGVLSNPSGLDNETTANFITRELASAIDQIGAMEIADNDESYSQAWLDYLLLTLETTRWYFSHEAIEFNRFGADTCLLRQNLQYYFDHHAPELDANVKQAVLTRLEQEEVLSEDPYCLFAVQTLQGTDKAALQETILTTMDKSQMLTEKSWPVGYATLWEDWWVFDVYANALAAGLLAQ